MYSLIMSSKLPDAKKFKRWVTSEVLPAIRRTGTYRNLSLEKVFSTEAEEKLTGIINKAMDEITSEIVNRTVKETVAILIPCFNSLYYKMEESEKNDDVEKSSGKSAGNSAPVTDQRKNKIKRNPRNYQNSKIFGLPQNVRHQLTASVCHWKSHFLQL